MAWLWTGRALSLSIPKTVIREGTLGHAMGPRRTNARRRIPTACGSGRAGVNAAFSGL